MQGVTVLIKNTPYGTDTGEDGKYKVKIPSRLENPIVVFSFIGYKTQEYIIKGSAIINVKMTPDVSDLDEVVVVGYGKSEKKYVKGAVSSISKKVLETNTFTSIGSLIQGQLPGVYVQSGSGVPGSPVRIRIRGDATLGNGADPLIVINGIPMPADFNLEDISPDDISGLDVLKGASASAIYGSRALSGVVVITTKKGTKYTKPVITYSITTSTKSLADNIKQLNGDQFREMWDEGVVNRFRFAAGVRGTDDEVRASNFGSFNNYEYFLQQANIQNAQTNWVDLILGNGFTTAHNLAMRGGNENLQYSFSYNDLSEEGIVLGTKFKRNTLSANFDNQFSDNIKMGLSFIGGISTRNIGGTSIHNAISKRPDVPAFNEDGSYYHDYYYTRSGFPWAPVWALRVRDNPLVLAKEVKNDNINRNINLIPYLEIRPFKDLTFRTQFGYYTSLSEIEGYEPSFTDASLRHFLKLTADGGGLLRIAENKSISKTFSNYFTYLKEVNQHDISATLGMEWNNRVTTRGGTRYQGFPDDYILNTPNNARTSTKASFFETRSTSVGYFGRVDYRFKNRYLFGASARIDGSSRFGSNNSYAFFPSLSAGYIISDEPFFESIKNTLNLLKLRFSYGKSGNDNVWPYEQLASVSGTGSYLDNPTLELQKLGNPNLKWEISEEFNFGLDFGLFEGNRIRGSIDVYNKDVNDLLLRSSLPPSVGGSTIIQNVGAINNKGIELSLSAVVIQKENLTFDLALNIAKNKNTLVSFGERDRGTALNNPASTVIGDILYEVGKPLGLIYGFQTDGLFKSYEEIDAIEAIDPTTNYQEPSNRFTIPGHIKYVDNTGDGRISINRPWSPDDEDRVVIGNTQPDFTGGFNMNFQYENFRLNVRSTFQVGGDKYWAYGENQFRSNNTDPNNVDAIALQRWTPENPNAKYPAFVNSYYNTLGGISDFWLYDASHLKIQEIVLSYNVSKEALERINFIQRVTLFGSVNNVATFTKYPGYGLGGFGAIDNASYPQERIFRLGVKIDF